MVLLIRHTIGQRATVLARGLNCGNGTEWSTVDLLSLQFDLLHEAVDHWTVARIPTNQMGVTHGGT
jgi:hypothetical protein